MSSSPHPLSAHCQWWGWSSSRRIRIVTVRSKIVVWRRRALSVVDWLPNRCTLIPQLPQNDWSCDVAGLLFPIECLRFFSVAFWMDGDGRVTAAVADDDEMIMLMENSPRTISFADAAQMEGASARLHYIISHYIPTCIFTVEPQNYLVVGEAVISFLFQMCRATHSSLHSRNGNGNPILPQSVLYGPQMHHYCGLGRRSAY